MKRRLTTLTALLFLLLGAALAQVQVKGIVYSDDDGQPIFGASVKVVGTSQGASTDLDGRFTLSVPSLSSQLEISYLGMLSQKVKAEPNLIIRLKSDNKQLDEIVVTGYGVTRKQAFTGAAATLDGKEIANRVDPNPIKALEGTVPGLQMNIGSGQPGAPATIFIRGRNSINSGTQPLYVIDGVPFNNDVVGMRSNEGAATSPLSTLSSADIENITVLKDATATSIYGARAANGVIVITTKRGKQGKVKVNFSAKVGWNEMPSYTDRYKLVNAEQNIELAKEALMNGYKYHGEDGSTFGYFNNAYGLGLQYTPEGAEAFYDWYSDGWVSAYRQNGVSTDWMKEISRKGMVNGYTLDVQGGGNGEFSPLYYAAFSYDKNVSFMRGKDLSRYSFRFNLDHKVSKVVKYGFNTNLSFTETNNGAGGGYFSDPLTLAYVMNPLTSPYLPNGDYNMKLSYAGYNPVAMRSKNGDINNAKQYRVLLSPYLQINFTPNLFFLSRAGVDAFLVDEFGYWSLYNSQGKDQNGMGENGTTTRMMFTITNTLNYLKTFNDVHNVNLMLGQEGQRRNFKYAYLSGNNYPLPTLVDVALAAKPTSANTNRNELLLNSYFFNGQYDYSNKYYLSASLRTDGSSRFAEGHRWGWFWSVGAKYRLTEEKFMEPVKMYLTNLSLRTSYGTTGNQEVGDADVSNGYYAALGLYGFGYNYNGQGGFAYEQVDNPDLTWERTNKFNVGIDFTLFDRVNFTFDYYNHQTTDMVFAVPLSYTTRLATIYKNIGQLENQGFEMGIGANVLRTKNINWTVNWNGSINKNKVKKLATDRPIESTLSITEVGRPIYQWKMKEYAGVNPDTGEAQWYLNETGDEVTTSYNKAAKRYLGDANPKFFGAFGTNLEAYGFDLSLQFNYSTGAKIYADHLRYDAHTGSSFNNNFIQYIYDNRWKQPGDHTLVPRLDSEPTNADKASSRFLMDGDYLKIRALTLGYTLPQSLVKTISLSSVRVFFEADNIYTFTKDNYIGFDPAGVGANGVQWWNYPQARTFLFGVQVGF